MKKKIVVFTILLTSLLIITGCDKKEEKNSGDAIKNTSISEGNVKSYRLKVSIKSSNLKHDYIVFNKENKEYNIYLINDNINAEIKNGKTTITDSNGKEIDKKLEYDYTNTDLYLKGINLEDSEVSGTTIKSGNNEYTKYTFRISKEKFNEMMKPFNIETTTSGDGYVYIDKNNYVYLINYNVNGVRVSISYTSIETKK